MNSLFFITNSNTALEFQTFSSTYEKSITIHQPLTQRNFRPSALANIRDECNHSPTTHSITYFYYK